MLSNQHFYHRVTRRLVVGFGTLFNNIKLYRYTKDGSTEIERVTVPLTYATKEKFYTRITQDPTLGKEIQITLPRMSFEMTSIAYDPLRKTSIFNQFIAPGATNNVLSATPAAPYNFNFDLYLYVRNTEDGTQIIEQILPYFAPDHTLTMDISTLIDQKVDIPVILNSINYEQNALGESDQLRTLVWNLNFTVKAWLYGPVSSNSKIIRKVTANTYDSTYIQTGERKINLTSGSGDYKIGELVYEGRTLKTANSSGFVKSWDNVANQVTITEVNGSLQTNRALKGAITNTAYVISTFDLNDNQLVNLTVTPDPSTANANDDFGFTETIEEYPNIT